MKVKTILIQNIKAVSDFVATFDGCTAIVTGKNGCGKSTAIKVLSDRLRGIKPEFILKQGEDNGRYEIHLTDGSKFVWELTSKTKTGEKLTFVTKDGIKTSVTRAISERYFPDIFDVDKFLTDQPKVQKKTLEKISGVDLTEITKRYIEAYDARTSANTIEKNERLKFEAMVPVEKNDPIDIELLEKERDNLRTQLNERYKKNKTNNENLRKNWNLQCEAEREAIERHNELQVQRVDRANDCSDAYSILKKNGIVSKDVEAKLELIKNEIEPQKKYAPLAEPEYIEELPDDTELKELDKKISLAGKANEYQLWINQKQACELAKEAALEADSMVNKVEKEKESLIKSANLPAGFSFSEDGILFNGLPFTRAQQASSAIYIAALKLAAMTVGEIRMLHFDASYLDKVNLMEIEQWANENDLQLLIERPDFDAGEISYHIIEK